MTDIFISYSHKDEAWKDELQAHLDVLKHHAAVSVWDDRQIKGGEDWYPAIEQAINAARVAILLVSRDFLRSEFVNREEIPKLLARRKAGGLRVLPLIVQPCSWRYVPWLASLQGMTKDNEALARFALGSYELQSELAHITDNIAQMLLDAREQEAQERQQQAEIERQRKAAEERERQAAIARQRKAAEERQQQAEIAQRPVPPKKSAITKPTWADRAGQDQFGYYADLDTTVEKKGWFSSKTVVLKQRFRLIEPGTFLMGSPENEPGRYDNEIQHEVTLTQAFWLADTTVTQALWEAVMGANPSRYKGAERPVETVSWKDAQGFLSKINAMKADLQLCLPSEAQWEYACRAGTTTAFSFGGRDDLNRERVNYSGQWDDSNAAGETKPVRSYAPNSWGLYEMHGNVLEWCQDWYDAYPKKISTDPNGSEAGVRRVLRGGSWINLGGHCRSAYRNLHDPANRNDSLGFRLARGLELP